MVWVMPPVSPGYFPQKEAGGPHCLVFSQRCLKDLKPGDTLIVWKLDRWFAAMADKYDVSLSWLSRKAILEFIDRLPNPRHVVNMNWVSPGAPLAPATAVTGPGMAN
jgi:hypothetical protein